MGLLVTFLLGLFIVLGAIITIASKNSKKFITFSISLALSVIIMIIILDLAPELYEYIEGTNNKLVNLGIIIISTGFGFAILKFLDLFIPDHDGDGNKNLGHIGIISAIALVLHNIIEGMAVYSTVTNSTKSGLLLGIGVGLHNIPLGMVITSTLYKDSNKKKVWLTITLISLSTFVGGLVVFFLKGLLVNELLLAILLAVTLGMLLYITIMELIPKVFSEKDKKTVSIGLILGMVVVIIASLL